MTTLDLIQAFTDDIQDAMDCQANDAPMPDAYLYTGEELRDRGVGAVKMLKLDGLNSGWLSTESFQFHGKSIK